MKLTYRLYCIFKSFYSFVLIILFFLNSNCINAQVVPVKIDTSNNEIKERYDFINSFLKHDEIDRTYWHPKYLNKKYYNYANFIDYLWRVYTPKQITNKFYTKLLELELVNDSLSYFKLFVSDRKESNISMHNIYKFYIVKRNDSFYLDNTFCYDGFLFKSIKTKNIDFFVSPHFSINEDDFIEASFKIDSLKRLLNHGSFNKHITYYMCSSEEEMNNLSNIVCWFGGVQGYVNYENNTIIGITSNPSYLHEFVHILLGRGKSSSLFLVEGIASLYGGPGILISLEDGLRVVNEYLFKNPNDFQLLLEKKIQGAYNNVYSYTVGAIICKLLIQNFGIDGFMKFYNNPKINDGNLIEFIALEMKLSKKDVVNKLKESLNEY